MANKIDVTLQDLLQSAEQLAADTEGSGELPRVERNLQQLLEASQQLWNRVTTSGTQDFNGSILFGAKGVDLPKLALKLESLSSAKSFEPLEPIKDTDIKGYLKNERENAILSIIEETRNKTFNETREKSWNLIVSDWENEKMDILNSLTKMDDGDEKDMAPITEITLVNEPLRGTLQSIMDEEEIRYAHALQEYNHTHVIGATKPVLVAHLSLLSKSFSDKKVTELWEIVESMVTNVPVRLVDNPVRARESPEVIASFVSSARRYLAEKYRTYMRTVVVGDLWRNRLGGAPGLLPLIKGFVAVIVPPDKPGLEDGLIDGLPIWAVVYYCLRAGVPEAALAVAKLGGHNLDEIAALLEDIVPSPEKIARPTDSGTRLKFHRISKMATDPYKRAVYSILYASDASEEHPDVAKTVDDYLWIKLSQIRSEDAADEQAGHLTFHQLQYLILEEYGERHFKAYEQPHLYAKLLLLTAQFEAAIEFLSRVDRLRCHAVHIALALSEMGLLIVPSNVEAPLLSTEEGKKSTTRKINLARLIKLYTKKFEMTNPKEALQYYYFLRKWRTSDGENMFNVFVSELVLETRDFNYLLGTLQPDESRSKGLIDSFADVEIDTQKIIELVAADSQSKGLFEEAIAVYDLAKKRDRAMELLVRLLSQVLTDPPVVGSLRERIYMQATDIAHRYSKKPYEVDAEVSQSFYLLLDLTTFFDLYHSKDYQSALATIQKLNIIPFEENDLDSKISKFNEMSQELRRNIPDILIATMNMLFAKYKELKSAFKLRSQAVRGDEAGLKTNLELYRNQAHVLVTYAGAISYRMPGDTNSRLVQMEVLMN